MDAKLVGWARAVKARHRLGVATLWLFTDGARLPDPVAAAGRLPPGIGGVVLRDDKSPDRRALALALARVCRRRRLALSVAGDWRLAAALGTGVHLRGGRRPPGMPRWLPILTSSAHGARDATRARRAGAGIVFLSPAFATASHPGGAFLGPVRWGLTARGAGVTGALGGISGRNARRMPSFCRAVGAIGAIG
jgi:thiamine-phosphate pyrophosphorylase